VVEGGGGLNRYLPPKKCNYYMLVEGGGGCGGLLFSGITIFRKKVILISFFKALNQDIEEKIKGLESFV